MELKLERFWYQTIKLGIKMIVLLAIILLPVKSYAQSFKTINFQEVREFIRKIKIHRNSYNSFELQFREYSRGRLQIGKIYFKKPNQLRINYYDGNEVSTEIYLGDSKLIVYFIRKAIVYEQENFNELPNLGDFKLGSLDYLLKKYNFNFKKTKTPVPVFQTKEFLKFNLVKNPNLLAFHMRLNPKDQTERLDRLELWFLAKKETRGGGEIYSPTYIVKSSSRSIVGVKSEIYFSDMKLNQNIPADIFKFIIPNHVRIVKNFFSKIEGDNLGEKKK